MAANLRWAGLLSAAMHLFAAVLAAASVMPLTTRDGADERALYLLEHGLGWQLTWLAFALAALALLWLIVALRRRLHDDGPVPALTLALAATGVGVAVELVGHAIAVGTVPALVDQLTVVERYGMPAIDGGGTLLALVDTARRTSAMLTQGIAPLAYGLAFALLVGPLRRLGATGAALLAGANAIAAALMVGGTWAQHAALVTVGSLGTIATVIGFGLAIGFAGWARPLRVDDHDATSVPSLK